MSFDTKMDRVHDLVMTRVNGNQIKGNATYEEMLKRATKDDIKDYGALYSVCGYEGLYGTKLEMIEQIRNSYGS